MKVYESVRPAGEPVQVSASKICVKVHARVSVCVCVCVRNQHQEIRSDIVFSSPILFFTKDLKVSQTYIYKVRL